MGRMTGVRIFVYNHLDQVPEGKIITVPQLAKLSEVSGARNAIKRILKDDESREHPYWRVVDEDGSLLETVGGDTDHQREKLESEGVDVSDGRVDVEAHRFEPEKIES
jgi:alkylated DNA nucleotide flippase Atl1